MTREERELALYCLKASSDYHSEVCEECINYLNCDHKIQDDVTETIIKALEQETSSDAIRRQAVLETLDDMDNALDEDRTVENYKELLKECYEVLPSVNPQNPLTEEDYIELHDRFGDYVEFVVRDMVSGKGERWTQKGDNNPQYCDRNICVLNEYNGIGCDECEVMAESEGDE